MKKIRPLRSKKKRLVEKRRKAQFDPFPDLTLTWDNIFGGKS